MSQSFLYTLEDPNQLNGLFNGDWFRGRSEPRIAMVGRSNVGKSTLINMLTGHKVARVSSTPGKTRAINFFIWDECKAIIADLPGYGFAKRSSQEKNQWSGLIRSYFKADPNLQAVLLLLDSRHGPTESDLEAIDFIQKENILWMPVFTKSDQLKTQSDRAKRSNEVKKIFSDLGYDLEQQIWISNKDARSIQKLKKYILESSWQK